MSYGTFGLAVLDLRKWNTEPIKKVLVSLKQSHSAVRHNNGPVSVSATNWPIKPNLIKSISLSLSLSPSLSFPTPSLPPPHPPSTSPPHKHALKVPITFVRNKHKPFLCDSCVSEVLECLEGNFKIIRNCTTTSPTICKGCAEEHYFHPGHGEHGGCVPCSQPCGISYLETRKCETAHDRICTARNLPRMLGKSKYIKNGPGVLIDCKTVGFFFQNQKRNR